MLLLNTVAAMECKRLFLADVVYKGRNRSKEASVCFSLSLLLLR